MPLTLYSILIYPKLGYSYVTGHFTCRSCSHNTLKYGKGTLINMSDKMKGPGESDERMPDIEESQFSEGADNTPLPEEQPSNEDGTACKKDESASLLTRVIQKFGGKKRAVTAAAALVIVIFCLPMMFPQLFCTHKLWANATCTSPRTCKSCGKTEGEPLGHEWEEATCTVPKTCQRCGKTEGNPLGINRARGLPKLTTWTPPQRKYENAKNAERSLTLATKRKLLPFLATESFQFPQKALLIDLTRNSLISPIAAA